MNSYYPVVFPFYVYNEKQILMILSIFNQIKIFKPWFTEEPEFSKDEAYADYVHLQEPPVERKPTQDFKGALAQYYQWMMEYPDRTVRETIQHFQRLESEEEKIWTIRKLIRQRDQGTSLMESDQNFIRHLILYLAQEREKQRLELDDGLRLLKEKGSVLDGALEEINPDQGLLNDLPPFGADHMMSESHLSSVLEAWFGLFGNSLTESQPLITLEHPVFDLLKDGFRELGQGDESARILLQEGVLPDLSQSGLKALLSKKRRPPLKGIIDNFLTGLYDPDITPAIPLLQAHELPEEEVGAGGPPSYLRLEILYGDLSDVKGLEKHSRIFKELNRRTVILITSGPGS